MTTLDKTTNIFNFICFRLFISNRHFFRLGFFFKTWENILFGFFLRLGKIFYLDFFKTWENILFGFFLRLGKIFYLDFFKTWKIILFGFFLRLGKIFYLDFFKTWKIIGH